MDRVGLFEPKTAVPKNLECNNEKINYYGSP
jgi:hypothetical protein